MREDRLSSYEQWEHGVADALRVEYEHGMNVLRSGEMLEGVGRFTAGAGRHGSSA
jgi:enoyl-CoA hydratase